MKHVLKIILILYLFFTIGFIYSQSRWDKRVGSSSRKEACVNLNIDYDYGYLLSNVIFSPVGFDNGLLIKTDINGDILWEKVITDNSQFFSIQDANSYQDGGYLIIGLYIPYDGSPNKGPILIKLDSCGNKAWCNYYMNEGYDYGIHYDVMALEDSSILTLTEMHKQNGDHKVFLFSFSQNGELLWKKEYAKRQDYPEIYRPSVRKLYKFDNYYLISGDCYWAYDDQDINWLTAMFIKIDSNFNEEWLLPYGYSDSLLGEAKGIVRISDNDFLGYGKHFAEDNTKAVLMRFDAEGNETGYTIITDEQFNPPTNYNSIHDVWKLNDTLFIAGANFGLQMDGNPNGEYIFDLSGNIHQYNSRSGTWGPTTLKKTLDGNYLFGTTIDIGYQRDILLYKLNDSLESVPFDTIQYNYDSLCTDTILSGDISGSAEILGGEGGFSLS